MIKSYNYLIDDPHYPINMNETAVCLNCSRNRTIHARGAKTVSVMIGGAKYIRPTLAVPVAMDGTKLSVNVIFKGTPVGYVERQLPQIITDGIVCCMHQKA